MRRKCVQIAFILFLSIVQLCLCSTFLFASVSSIAGGNAHTVALKSDGSLWAWGWNYCGQLGDGTTTDRSSPVQVGSDTAWSAVATGYVHTVALKSDGTLWTWGRNYYGQLGDGTTTDRSSPAQVGSDTDWSAVAAGCGHTVALKSNGTIWAWGENNHGQLGDGTMTDRSSPVQVGSDTDWSAVVTKGFHTLALKSDGTLWAWGSNTYGVLGDGTVSTRTSPVQVGSDTNWSVVAASYTHTVALKSNGTLWAWGYNNQGQLGDGTTTHQTSPVQVGSDTNWAAVEAGYAHTVALKTDGTLWAWGRNDYGQLGDGTTEDKHSPVQVGSDTDWVAISAGLYHTVALKSDGTLWAWGWNEYGQLGDGTTTDRTSPVQVGTDSNWVIAHGIEKYFENDIVTVFAVPFALNDINAELAESFANEALMHSIGMLFTAVTNAPFGWSPLGWYTFVINIFDICFDPLKVVPVGHMSDEVINRVDENCPAVEICNQGSVSGIVYLDFIGKNMTDMDMSRWEPLYLQLFSFYKLGTVFDEIELLTAEQMRSLDPEKSYIIVPKGKLSTTEFEGSPYPRLRAIATWKNKLFFYNTYESEVILLFNDEFCPKPKMPWLAPLLLRD